MEKELFKGQVNDKMVEVWATNAYPRNGKFKENERVWVFYRVVDDLEGVDDLVICKPKELKQTLKDLCLDIKIDEKEIVFN